MWGRRVLYALTLLAAFLGQLFDVGYLFHFIFFAVLSLPVLSLLLSLPAILGCRAALESGEVRIRRGGRLEWTLRLHSRTGLPLARISCRLVVENRMTGETVRLRVPMRRIIPTGGQVLTMDAGRSGLVECRAEKLRICGCLGLLTRPLRPPPPAAVLVYPVPENPGPLALPEEQGMPRSVPRGKSASGEDYELRPYRAGDSLRTVHWKMSAKRDEMVTRELLEDRRPLPVLTIDHFGGEEPVERALDRLAGYALALLALERPFEVRWAHPVTGEIRRWGVIDGEAWENCLAALLSDPAPLTGRSILDVPLLPDQDQLLHHIHITGEEADYEEG